MTLRTPLLILAGAALGIGLVLACSDDAPGDADAAPVCDCPAAEPPLEGRIVLSVANTVQMAAGERRSTGADCNEGILLTGSCSIENGSSTDVTLELAGWLAADNPNVWNCNWHNGSLDPRVGVAQAKCLVPPAE
jgi:hypothetical protein